MEKSSVFGLDKKRYDKRLKEEEELEKDLEPIELVFGWGGIDLISKDKEKDEDE